MVRSCSVVWIAATTVWTSSAFAQQQDPREVQARKDCLTGKYESGVSLLADLFAETGNKNFIYNQARCYEQNGRPGDAISRFREYLRVAKDIGAADKAEVENHIADCRKLQTEQQRKTALATPSSPQAEQAAPPVPSPAAIPPMAPAPASAAVPAVAPSFGATASQSPPGAAGYTQTSVVAPAANPGHGLRVGGVICSATGIALVGAGLFFGLETWAYSNSVEAGSIYNSAFADRARLYENLQWVGYGTGAALLVTGTVLYWLGAGSAGTTQITLAPLLPSGAALAAKGTF